MTDTPTYQVDERVRVTLEGRIAEFRPDNPAWNGPEILLDPGDGSDGHLTVPLDWTGLTIDRLTPADGVPKPGQIWATPDGIEWYAVRTDLRSGSEIRLYASDGRNGPWRDIHAGAWNDSPITLVRDVAPKPAPEPVIDPDCRDGKCGYCFGGPCPHECHAESPAALADALGTVRGDVDE